MGARIFDRWYAGWFNQDYLDLYAHRNAQEARSVADFIAARLPGVGGGRTLDLGCGAGRHLPYLAERQPTVGLDLSPWLLEVAQQRNPGVPLSRSDMRSLPFRDASFNLVVSLFTSFGYFLDDAENAVVLEEVARVTTPSGWLVLDFLNAPLTRHTLVPFERKQVGDRWVRQARTISDDGRFVTKTIHIEENEREYVERVRLFEPDELMKMLRTSGFDVASLHGDYSGSGWTATSPRAIVVAQRRPPARLSLVSADGEARPARRNSLELRTSA
jgi:ubiquinone/menaquinone biosynthesis C-methylase UbiE